MTFMIYFNFAKRKFSTRLDDSNVEDQLRFASHGCKVQKVCVLLYTTLKLLYSKQIKVW